jgi:hypothetical protein
MTDDVTIKSEKTTTALGDRNGVHGAQRTTRFPDPGSKVQCQKERAVLQRKEEV